MLAACNPRDYDGVSDFYAQPMKLDFFGVSLRQFIFYMIADGKIIKVECALALPG